jgi:hypothetical protein
MSDRLLRICISAGIGAKKSQPEDNNIDVQSIFAYPLTKEPLTKEDHKTGEVIE